MLCLYETRVTHKAGEGFLLLNLSTMIAAGHAMQMLSMMKSAGARYSVSFAVQLYLASGTVQNEGNVQTTWGIQSSAVTRETTEESTIVTESYTLKSQAGIEWGMHSNHINAQYAYSAIWIWCIKVKFRELGLCCNDGLKLG